MLSYSIVWRKHMLGQIIIEQWVNLFVREDWEELIAQISSFILQVIAITLIYLLFKRLLRYVYEKNFSTHFTKRIKIKFKKQNKGRQKTINDLIYNSLNYALNFIYIYILLSMLGFPIGTLVAGAGIASVALGLAAQNFVKDVINGFFIILEHQFEIGDTIEIPQENISGTVVNTGIRTTTLKSFTGDIYYIPNSLIMIVKNTSRQSMLVRIELPITVNTSLEKYEEIVKEVTEQIKSDYADKLADEPKINGIIRGDMQSFLYRISFYTHNGMQFDLESDLYALYIKTLQDNQIPLAQNIFETQKDIETLS